MITEFATTVMYGQIVVAATGAPARALAWTDAHVAQGFSWAPDQVAFGVPDHDGQVLIQVETAPTPAVAPDALWAVQVPFEVRGRSEEIGSVEIGTILLDRPVAVPAGRYDLVFQALPGAAAPGGPYAYVMRISFARDETPTFAILKRGSELTTDTVLVAGSTV